MRKFSVFCGILAALSVVIALICRSSKFGVAAQNSLHATTPGQGRRFTTAVASRIPFVGCKSDGQGGPVSAPRGLSKIVHIKAKVAQRLAYYESEKQFGVLAPQGWYCFGTYGSDGDSLFVSPQPIDSSILFSTKSNGFVGPLIQLSRSSGDTSGRFTVAKIIARVFPAHREFVTKVVEEGLEPATSFPFGAYPKDQLIYKSDEVVEYQTPAQANGLGTDSLLNKDDDPISGVAMLTGPDSDLLHLSVRLPSSQVNLAVSIVQQLENDTASQSQSLPNSGHIGKNTASVSSSTRPETSRGFPVPEDMFVNAYVLANIGRDDLNQNQLAQLAHDEYEMAGQMDTQTVLLGGEFLDTRGKRAMDYLYKLSKQSQSRPLMTP